MGKIINDDEPADWIDVSFFTLRTIINRPMARYRVSDERTAVVYSIHSTGRGTFSLSYLDMPSALACRPFVQPSFAGVFFRLFSSYSIYIVYDMKFNTGGL